MTAKIDPYPVPLKTLVRVRVTATDDATGQDILGAEVFLNDLPMGKTPAEFTRRFDPRVVVIRGGDPSDPEIELAYPRLLVRESTYFDAEVDCGWPE
jgi:hypothetical protein